MKNSFNFIYIVFSLALLSGAPATYVPCNPNQSDINSFVFITAGLVGHIAIVEIFRLFGLFKKRRIFTELIYLIAIFLLLLFLAVIANFNPVCNN